MYLYTKHYAFQKSKVVYHSRDIQLNAIEILFLDLGWQLPFSHRTC